MLSVVEITDAAEIARVGEATRGFSKHIQQVQHEVEQGTVHFFAAMNNDEYVGRVCLKLSPADEQIVRERLPDVPLLWALEINEPMRKMGLGTMLWNAVIDKAQELDYTQIGLGVEPDNEPARKLYEKLGFSYEGTTHSVIMGGTNNRRNN